MLREGLRPDSHHFSSSEKAREKKPPVFWAALVLTTIICFASFVLSFVALADLLQLAGQPRALSYLFPAIIDGTILWPTLSILWASGRDDRATPKDRGFFWVVLLLGAGVSIAGNALHAWVSHAPGFSPVLAAVISTLPPISLLAASHGLTILARTPKTVTTVVMTEMGELRPATVSSPEPEPIETESAVDNGHAERLGAPSADGPTAEEETLTSAAEPADVIEASTVDPSASTDAANPDKTGIEEEPEPADSSEPQIPDPRIRAVSGLTPTAPSYEPIAADLSTATTEQLREYALRRVALGAKPKEVAPEVGRNISTIYRWIEDAAKTVDSPQLVR